ncbi:hypothetical protein BWI93_03460 [Siphonobacter sp. BAB-5385]|uniref:DUF3826 domain-containing protein n=1 Tax=Siphonobacter sp. BAB-5385 TaxID=1864822 RepID=UPI000B9EEA87|nr:DUF3826 domain-containing protein [Siphonobacter sp. BAB-5385]OZI09535.1 hypothetical protein BWI93_03460 [Siphonobacter sp. BAB-5385]
MNKILVTITMVVGISLGAKAQNTQQEAEAYTQTITKRAEKIVTPLHTPDSVKVRDIIVDQYRQLNTMHDLYNAQIKQIKAATDLSKEIQETKIRQVEDQRMAALEKAHSAYLSKLKKVLSEQQIEAVKDGMTYGVLPITYKGYQEMLPDLTEGQKKQILAYLTEARERAMDAESSNKKHAWFGKYKGKINNYLSASGIDMKQASKAWEERIAREKNKLN